MATGNGTPRYRVLYPPGVQDQFQRWADRAVEVGQLEAYGRFLLQMSEQLVHTPLGWADSVWTVPGRPGLRVCWRYNRLVRVLYAVSLTGYTVRIIQAVLPHGSPLADGGDGP